MSVDLLRPGSRTIGVHPSKSLPSSSTLVIGTNDSSILSKRSAERLGYFTQPQFLKHFINKPQRRTSLINIGYTIRTLIIDLIIKRFLHSTLSQSCPTIIVNLGCGYDPGFFKLATNQINSFFHYVDVDYPELISKKYQLIAQSEELNQILPAFTNSKIGDSLLLPNNKAAYTLLGCDLCDSKTFIQKLSHLIDGRNDAHILFISEVSTVYMPAGKSDELIQNISLSFPHAIWSCLEQVLSSTPTAFSDTMLKHFHKLRTPIRGTLAYPTISDQLNRFGAHWKVIEMSTMHDVWKAFDLNHSTYNEKERLMTLEEFDEWEELDLFLSHYVVTIAYSKPALMDPPQLPTGIALPPLQHRSQHKSRVLSSQKPAEPDLTWCYASADYSIHRRGHTSTSLPDRQLLVFGGFGLPNEIKSSTNQKLKSSLTHARLSHPLILGFTRSLSIQTTHLPIDHSTPSPRLYHSASLVIKDDHSPVVFFFGGRSSPRVPLADAYMFNCTTHTWTPVNPSGTESPWPPPRFRHAALTIQIDNSTYVLIHGGIGLEGTILNDSWLFNPYRNCWTRLIVIEKFIGPRHSHQIYYDLRCRELFFFGGITAIYDQSKKTRLGNNIKLALTFGKDLALEIQSDLPELLDLKLDDALLHRYSHRITAWDEETNTLIMSGGVSANGVITTEHQYVLLDLKSGVCRVLQLPRQKAQTMIGHTISVIDVCPLGESQPRLKAALVVGGGATCFSFGSSFDTLVEIISDSDLSLIEDAHSSEKNESEVNRKTCGTFDSSREDTWDKTQEVTRIDKMTNRSWMDVLSASKPAVFDTRNEIGKCIELWTPEYLKMKCGEKKCSIHLSHSHSSTTLKWHDKNFQYDMIRFSELIDRTINVNKSLAAGNRDQVVYLRSLSHSPKQASNFHCDFAEISNDFKIPQPVNDYIRDHDAFFSSVLRISGADMGLWAHYDTYDNILVQVKGEKLVRLWHPSEIVNLYIEGSSSHIPSFDTPDLDRFPLYRKSHPMVCILKVRQTCMQKSDAVLKYKCELFTDEERLTDAGNYVDVIQPGDTLFIPANWIHAIQTLEPSISINTFFRTEPLEKFYDVRKKDIWGNVDLAPYHDLYHHIFHQLTSPPKLAHPAPNQFAPLQSTLLDHLPLPQRQFYLKKIALDLIRYADQLSQPS